MYLKAKYSVKELEKKNKPDRVVSSQTDPLRDGSILLLLLGKMNLNLEGFLGGLKNMDERDIDQQNATYHCLNGEFVSRNSPRVLKTAPGVGNHVLSTVYENGSSSLC